jgi:hypothetical protein
MTDGGMRPVRCVPVLLLLALACGDGSSMSDAGSDAIAPPNGACTGGDDLGPLPDKPASCAMNAPLVCPLVGRECPLMFESSHDLELTAECGGFCGDAAVALRNGCVVGVDLRRAGVLRGSSEAAVKACVRQRLVGSDWSSCALGDGWWKLFLGSCQ